MSLRISLPSPSYNVTTANPSRNPIALRLRKILGTNFTDEATVDALRTVSKLYSVPIPSTSHSQSEGSELDEGDWSDSDPEPWLQEPHQQLQLQGSRSNGVDETASRARKNLERDLENELAEGNRHFLKAFAEVDQKLDELQKLVAEMRIHYDEAEAQLGLTEETSRSLLEQAESLRQERQDVETRKSIVSFFLDRFTLPDEEAGAIISRDIAVGPRFFAAMDKTERIRADCRILMSGEDGPTRAGLDIMAATSSYLEQGYDKLYRWCTFEFRRIGAESQFEVSPTMLVAVRWLSKRLELLSEALTFLSQARQSALLGLFLEALTRGGPSGLPRPIELHAHDPLRYVGDMLAWVHQAIAAECELLESLFGISESARMVGAVRTFGGSGEEEWVRDLLNATVGKLCVPLKVRVLQTVRAQEDIIVSYNVANLLQYYSLTMQRTIGDQSVLSKTLQEITEVGYKVFFDAIETRGRALLRTPLDLDDPSLSPPRFIMDHAQLLREIMQVYDSSLTYDDRLSMDATAGFRQILDIMVDPAVAVCAAAAEKATSHHRWDSAVFMLNCLCYVKNVLQPFSFTAEKQREMQSMIKERASALEKDHYDHILREASLLDAVHTMGSKDPATPLSRLPDTEPKTLQASLAKFSLWLSTPDTVCSPRLATLSSAVIAGRVHRAASRRLVRAYERLCDEVRSPRARYEAGSVLLGRERPFGQVGLLWQIFGLGEDEEEDEGNYGEDHEAAEDDDVSGSKREDGSGEEEEA